MKSAEEPQQLRLLIKEINSLAERAGRMAADLGLPLAPAPEILREAGRRGITGLRLQALQSTLKEIGRLKKSVEAAWAKNKAR